MVNLTGKTPFLVKTGALRCSAVLDSIQELFETPPANS